MLIFFSLSFFFFQFKKMLIRAPDSSGLWNRSSSHRLCLVPHKKDWEGRKGERNSPGPKGLIILTISEANYRPASQ